MGFVEDTLAAARPDSVAALDLPRRQHYHPSPASWQDEVVYFLLVDRFSDGAEAGRPLLDRSDRASARPGIDGQPFCPLSGSLPRNRGAMMQSPCCRTR